MLQSLHRTKRGKIIWFSHLCVDKDNAEYVDVMEGKTVQIIERVYVFHRRNTGTHDS